MHDGKHELHYYVHQSQSCQTVTHLTQKSPVSYDHITVFISACHINHYFFHGNTCCKTLFRMGPGHKVHRVLLGCKYLMRELLNHLSHLLHSN